MKGKELFFVLSLMTLCFTGCVTTGSLYPVQGPLTAEPKVIKATFGNIGTGHGKVKITMPDGEVCEGEYSTVAGGTTSFVSGYGTSTGTAIAGGTVITSNDWGSVFGQACSFENKQRGMATAIGNKGTVISIEYFVDAWSGHGFGLGKDNKGNLYRIQF